MEAPLERNSALEGTAQHHVKQRLAFLIGDVIRDGGDDESSISPSSSASTPVHGHAFAPRRPHDSHEETSNFYPPRALCLQSLPPRPSYSISARLTQLGIILVRLLYYSLIYWYRNEVTQWSLTCALPDTPYY